jgi:FkbH-like protein
LIEDGAATLQPKPGIIHVLEALDRRGILQSIASKNTETEAVEVLRRFDIADFFLYPHISFEPKSQAIHSIARHLNIGIDAMLFVDDSEFELEQVSAACPGVRVLNAKHYRLLPELKELSAPVTTESKSRRKMYQVEWTRQQTAKEFLGDYTEFLRQCNLELRIRPLNEANIERVHELTQRTNQMNFSGTRYERDILKMIATSFFLDTYVIECNDRFGSYGTVGFGIVDNRVPCLTDLMFSCRVQAKRVEHAVLGYVVRKYIMMTGKAFYAQYRRTPHNSASGKVFADIGMKEVEVRDGVSRLVFPYGATIPDDRLINILVLENTLCDVHQ